MTILQAREFRQYAEEALYCAHDLTTDPEETVAFLDLAFTWTRAALVAERNDVLLSPDAMCASLARESERSGTLRGRMAEAVASFGRRTIEAMRDPTPMNGLSDLGFFGEAAD